MTSNYDSLLKKLKKQEKTEILTGFRLFNLCSFRVGGEADLVITPGTENEFITTLGVLNEANVPYIVIGSASNLLFSDEGFRGAVVRTHNLNSITVKDNILTAEAGVPLSQLSRTAMENEIGGFHGL